MSHRPLHPHHVVRRWELAETIVVVLILAALAIGVLALLASQLR